MAGAHCLQGAEDPHVGRCPPGSSLTQSSSSPEPLSPLRETKAGAAQALLPLVLQVRPCPLVGVQWDGQVNGPALEDCGQRPMEKCACVFRDSCLISSLISLSRLRGPRQRRVRDPYSPPGAVRAQRGSRRSSPGARAAQTHPGRSQAPGPMWPCGRPLPAQHLLGKVDPQPQGLLLGGKGFETGAPRPPVTA